MMNGHKSEEQVEPVGQCPCGHELLLHEGKIVWHDCPYGQYEPFDMVEFAGIVFGMGEKDA